VNTRPGKTRSLFRGLKAIVVVTVLVATGRAQDPAPQTLESLEQQVRELQQQVKALESRLDKNSAPAAGVSPVAEPAAEAVAAVEAAKEDHDIHIRGFGEANYKALDQRKPELGAGGFVPGSAANFYSGNFDLLLTAAISDKARVLAEINFEETDAQTFEVDLERLLLNYDFNDHLRVAVGRYQTSIGYYNTVYHNGAWPQTTVDRPLIMEFPDHGGILPVQAIGTSFQGLLPSGKLNLNYVFEYGSSDTMRSHVDGSPGLDDENNGNQVNVGLFMRPDWVPGLQVGGSAYHDEISDDRNLTVRYGQTILNGHVTYSAHGVEFLNEGVLVRHAEEMGPTVFNMPGFYTQISKQIGHIRPFFRYQYVNTNPRSALHDVLLRYGPSFGARYDFDSNIALKLQFDHTVRKSLPDLNGIQTQLAFTF
jgi:hypothetical protein